MLKLQLLYNAVYHMGICLFSPIPCAVSFTLLFLPCPGYFLARGYSPSSLPLPPFLLSSKMGPTKLSQPLRIAIIGGGIGGTVLALALSKYQNITFTIYESRSEFSEIGAGFALGPNAHRVVQLISPILWEGYKSRASFKGYKPADCLSGWEETEDLWADFTIGEGENEGKRIIAVSMKNQMTLSTAHRADFMEELVKLLPEGCAEFNKKLVEVQQREQKVICRFADGSEIEADAVIGCDGIRSTCRQFVFEKELVMPVFSQKVAYRGLVPMDLAEAAMGKEEARNRNMYLGHGRHVVTFSVRDGVLMNVVAISSRESWEGKWVQPGQKKEMMRDFAGWGEKVTKILEVSSDIPQSHKVNQA